MRFNGFFRYADLRYQCDSPPTRFRKSLARGDNILDNPMIVGRAYSTAEGAEGLLAPTATLSMDYYYAADSDIIDEKRSKTVKLQTLIAGLRAAGVTRDSNAARSIEETKEGRKEPVNGISKRVAAPSDTQRYRNAIADACRRIVEIWKDGPHIYELTTVVIYEKGTDTTLIVCNDICNMCSDTIF